MICTRRFLSSFKLWRLVLEELHEVTFVNSYIFARDLIRVALKKTKTVLVLIYYLRNALLHACIYMY